MDWQQLFIRLGLPMLAEPNLAFIGLAVLVVLGAYVSSHIVAVRSAARLENWWQRRTGEAKLPIHDRSSAVIQHLMTALLLLAAISATATTPGALLVIAVGLGVAAGLLTYHLLRGANLTVSIAWTAGALVLLAATAAPLGGLRPLAAGLDTAAFRVSDQRVSVLDVLNLLFVAAILYVMARLVRQMIDRLIARTTRLDPTQRVLAQKLAAIAIVITVALIGIDIAGLDLAALAVFSGALGLAVGFGLQKTFGNLIAGLILLMDRSIKPGDVIVVGDTFGVVSKVGVRAVSVLTRDGKEHLIPNEQLMTERVENWSYSNRNVRIRIPVSVAYDCDLDLAQRLMIEAAKSTNRVLANPPPGLWLTDFGENSVEHEILVWIADPDEGVGSVRSEIFNRVWRLFKAHGIGIPFPQRDLHLRDLPAELIEAVGRLSAPSPHR